MVKKIIQKLIENAFKYSPQDFLLDQEQYDLSEEDVEYLRKKIEDMK